MTRTCSSGPTVTSCAARWRAPMRALPGSRPQRADSARTDARTGLLTLDAFRGRCRGRPRPRRRRRAARLARARRHRPLPLAQRPPRAGRRRRRPARGRRPPEGAHARRRRPRAHRRRRGRGPHAGHAARRRPRVLRAPARRLEAPTPARRLLTVSAGVAAYRDGTTLERPARRRRAWPRSRPRRRRRACRGGRPAEAGRRPPAPRPHVIDALATALLERDRYTGEHSESVVEMAARGRRNLGLDEVEVERVGAAALLHDIGKIGVPDRILHKPGPLADEEWELMREHPVIGERILRAIPGLGRVARIVRHEHERCDGARLPRRARRRRIPLGSRIILACDAYHAMTSDRPYRAAMPHARGASPSSCAARAPSSTRAWSRRSSAISARASRGFQRRRADAAAGRSRPSRSPSSRATSSSRAHVLVVVPTSWPATAPRPRAARRASRSCARSAGAPRGRPRSARR